ncbi:hypothetical protein GALL_434610 [mine drainage metagenome]|uniref:Uncharacterized protein n=1 Tax=mine drainage metagenome TaxID=410659 RepID=A0A1J5PTS8_9ZZZZ
MNRLAEFDAGMGIAERVLQLEQFAKFGGQIGARERVAVAAALVALGVSVVLVTGSEFAQGAVTRLLQQYLVAANAREHRARLFVLLGLGLAIGLETPVLDDVVQHARPFLGCQRAVESLSAQLPRRQIGQRESTGVCFVDQSDTFHQPRKAQQSVGPPAYPAARQSRVAPYLVERLALLGRFSLVESSHMQREYGLLIR